MSLYGMLTTSASGMSAQSTLLSTVSDNIGNVDTIGYKSTSAEFASLVLSSSAGSYQSGNVQAATRTAIDAQGAITSTTNPTDLAIQGAGFFVVQDSSGDQLLTRAGSFVENSSGNLVNSAGYDLVGYQANAATGALSGTLSEIKLAPPAEAAYPSTTGQFSVNISTLVSRQPTQGPPRPPERRLAPT